MSPLSTIAVTLVVALMIVLGGVLLAYVSSLVKSAYQIRVELRNDLDAALTEQQADIERRTKWMKREASDEIAKVRSTIEAQTTQGLADMHATLVETTQAVLEANRQETSALKDQVAALEARLQAIEQRIGSRRGGA